jgi:phage gp36-like protein
MSWLTTGDIEARMQWSLLLELADDDGDGQPDAAVLDALRADAEGEVEAALMGRYEVPISSPDKVLTEIASAIVIAKLHLRKSAPAPEQVQAALAQAMETLGRLARGEANLSVGTPRGSTAQSTVSPEDRTFTRDSLEAY